MASNYFTKNYFLMSLVMTFFLSLAYQPMHAMPTPDARKAIIGLTMLAGVAVGSFLAANYTGDHVTCELSPELIENFKTHYVYPAKVALAGNMLHLIQLGAFVGMTAPFLFFMANDY